MLAAARFKGREREGDGMGGTANDAPTAKDEWRHHWPVVVTSFMGYSFLGLVTFSFSVFIEPLSREFGWSRTFLSSGYSLSTLLSALLSPLFGMALDRWGPRRLALPGIFSATGIIAAFSLISGAAWQWYMLWALYSVFSVASKQTTWVAALTRRFELGRGLAIGMASTGGALTQVVVPPLTVVLISAVGWRLTYVVLAFAWGTVTFLCAWLFLHDRRPRPRKASVVAPAHGSPPTRDHSAEPVIVLQGLTIAEAWRSRALWSIAISTVLVLGITVGFAIHQVPILRGVGMSNAEAAMLVGIAGVSGLCGQLMTGALLDRFNPNWVGGITLAGAAASFGALLSQGLSLTVIFMAMLVNGYTQGAKSQICSYLTARHAGGRSFGAIFGFMNSMMGAGASIGPLLAGLAYDVSGAYTPYLIGCAIGCAIASALLISLPATPSWSRKATPDEAIRA
ncbi:MAG TPA: MFS transporter [Novosphingobium sp.]